MYSNRCVTSNVYFRSGALTPPFLGGLGWPDFLADFFKKANGWKWISPLVQMTPILLQWCLLLQGPHNTSHHPIWASEWPEVKFWLWKVGFTPQAIRRACRSLHFLRSGVARRSCRGLSFGAELEKYKLRHAYSIHIFKTPLFGPSDDHLWRKARWLKIERKRTQIVKTLPAWIRKGYCFVFCTTQCMQRHTKSQSQTKFDMWCWV